MDEMIWGCAAFCILIGIPLSVLYAFVRLFRRVGKLESKVEALTGRFESASVAAPAAAPAEPPPSDSTESVAPEPVETPTPEPALVVEAAPSAASEKAASEEVDSESAPEPEPEPETQEPSEPWWTGLEEKIWTKLPVWIGAIALALAAAYLVKLSFDRGWISPAVRVAAGVAGGIALLLAGDRLRRSSDYVAQGLSASGISALFVSFWAATNLYDLVPWWLGFGLMTLTTATAVLLSLRQGYLIAVLGLVGGFVTPALVSSESTRPWALFSYLLLLQIGLVVVARRRAWGSLSVLTLLGGFLWLFFFLSDLFAAADSIWVGLFLLASVATFCFQYLGKRQFDGEPAELLGVPVAQLIGWGAMGGGLLAASALTVQAGYGLLEWGVLGLLAAGCYALARLDESYHPLAWLAALVVTFQLGAWQQHVNAEQLMRFLGVHAAFFLLLAVAAWLFARGTSGWKSRMPGAWATLATTVGVSHFLLVMEAETRLALGDVHWGAVAALLGAVYVLACVPFARLRSTDPDSDAENPLAALAVGATLFFSLALPLELERQWLTVSWALEVVALLWLAGRLRVPALRWFAWVLTAGVGMRLLLNPEVLTYPIGTTPVLNWLLYGYGFPIVSFLAAARLANRQGAGKLEATLRWLAYGLTFALVTLQIRQYFFPGDLDSGGELFLEWATYLVAWSAMAWGSLWWSRTRPLPVLALGGRILAVATVLFGSFALGLALNPALHREYVGELPVLNYLLWGYGVPALLLFLVLRLLPRLAEQAAARFDRALGRLLSVALLLDVFTLVTLQVRQAFRGGFLNQGSAGTAENYAYSIAWIVLGITLALAGRRVATARWGSLCVLLPATLKVFLYDTSELEGLWRVASLVGLGLSLMGLAYFFQRFVFRRGASDLPGEEA